MRHLILTEVSSWAIDGNLASLAERAEFYPKPTIVYVFRVHSVPLLLPEPDFPALPARMASSKPTEQRQRVGRRERAGSKREAIRSGLTQNDPGIINREFFHTVSKTMGRTLLPAEPAGSAEAHGASKPLKFWLKSSTNNGLIGRVSQIQVGCLGGASHPADTRDRTRPQQRMAGRCCMVSSGSSDRPAHRRRRVSARR
jgi:hypothetical protein